MSCIAVFSRKGFLKVALYVFVSAAMICGFAGCSFVERDLEEKTYNIEVPPRMVFLGDSIAAGYGLDGYTKDDNYNCPDSYANILKALYTEELSDICEHEMQNFAVSGDTSSDLLELLETGKLDPALAESDAVVISIGGNDMLHIILDSLNTLGIDPEKNTVDFSDIDFFSAASALLTVDAELDEALIDFEANLKNISTLLDSKTEGKIFIQTLYNPLEVFTDISVLTDFSSEKMEKFNEIIRSNASDKYTVIEVAPEFDGRCRELTRMESFDIHPNEKGHKVIAEAVDTAFRSTGFTCTVEEYGDPYLPISSVLLILGGFCAMILIVCFIIPRLFKKYENKI